MRDRNESGSGADGLTAGRLARSTAWAAVDNWIQHLAQLLTFLVVGRIVGPEIFGIMVMAFVVIMFAQQVLVDGLGEAIVRHPVVVREHLEAVFWASAGLGVLTMLATFAVAPPIARAFGEPVLVPVLLWVAPVFPLMATGSALQCKLRRELGFRALALRSLISYGIASPLTVALALAGHGIWSLVAYQLVQRSVDFLAVLVLARWRPRLRLSLPHLRELLGFGLANTGLRMVDFLAIQVDRVIVGFVLGATALGLYNMARRMAEAVVFALTGVVNMVALSAFSRLQHDPLRLERFFNTTTYLAGLLVLPLFAGLALVASPAVGLLLGPAWQGMVTTLQILCLYGVLRSEGYLLGSLMRALGRADLVVVAAVIGVVAQTLLVLLVVGRGIEAVALAIGAATLLMLLVQLALARRFVLRLAWRPYLGKYATALGATLLTTLAVLGADRLTVGMAEAPRLVLLIVAGGAGWALALGLLDRGRLVDLARSIRAGEGG